MESPQLDKGDSSTKVITTLTIIGILIILFALYILYRGERVNNPQWEAKSAKVINPDNPSGNRIMVKFTGKATGDLIMEPLSGEKLILLRKSVYLFENKKKTETRYKTKDGNSEKITRIYFKKEWVYKKTIRKKAKNLQIGKIKIRLTEAEFLGDGPWQQTFFVTKNGNKKKSLSVPELGDKKISLSGIKKDQLIFSVGFLQDGYLTSGPLFLLSTYSEKKTISELHETKWIRGPFSFGLLLLGFILLIHPSLFILKKFEEVPLCQFLAKGGWLIFIPISITFAYLIVKYSHWTVDLIWLILLLIIIVPVTNYIRNKKENI